MKAKVKAKNVQIEAAFDLEAMNQAAARAEKDFKSCRTAKDVCAWFARWYLTAGHKRLGRFLVAQAKKDETKNGH